MRRVALPYPQDRFHQRVAFRLAVLLDAYVRAQKLGEVLSSSSARHDRVTKRPRYQRNRVEDYWIVDPDSETVECWTPDDARPAIAAEQLVWHPAGATEPFTLDVPAGSLVIGLCAGGAGPVVAQVGSAWSAPKAIAGAPSTRSIRSPSVAVKGDTLYVAASLWPTSPGSPMGMRQLLLSRVPGGPLSIPDGVFSFAFPQGLVDRAGTYHLFWTEFRSFDSTRATWPSVPNSLWHAAFAHGAWSAPEKLLDAVPLYWNGEQGHVALDSNGVVHVAVAAFATNQFEIAHLSSSGGTWQSEHIPTWALYAAIAATRQHLYLVFVTPDSGGQSTTRLVSRRTSLDGVWESPVAIIPDARRDLAHPIALAQRDSLHVLWSEASATFGGTHELHYAVSADPRTAWQEKTSTPVQGVSISTRAALTPCGPTVIVETLEPTATDMRAALREIRLGDSPLVTGRAIYPRFPVTVSGGLAPAGDSLALVFAAVRDSSASASVEVGRRSLCASTKTR